MCFTVSPVLIFLNFNEKRAGYARPTGTSCVGELLKTRATFLAEISHKRLKFDIFPDILFPGIMTLPVCVWRIPVGV